MEHHNELKKTLLLVLVIALFGVCFVWLFYQTKQEENYEISVIVGEENAGRWTVMQQGMESAANNAKVQINFYPIAEVGDSEEQITLLLRELDKQVDAIVIDAVDSEKLMYAIQDTNTNIPIILVETDLTPGFLYTQITPDNYEMGKSMGKVILEEKQKTIAVMLENRNAIAQTQRRQGLLDSLKGQDIKIEWTVLGPEEILQSNPYETEDMVDAIVALDGNSTEKAVEWVKEKAWDTHIYGVGNSEANIYYLDKGMIRALIIPNEYNMGYLSIETAVNKITRQETEQNTVIEHIVVTKNTLYEEQNQRLVFPFVQ